MTKKLLLPLLMIASMASAAFAANCQNLPSDGQIRAALIAAAAIPNAGGLFAGSRMWGAVVNRDGEHCGASTSTADATQVWPGSQAIAKSKAYTANAYSLDTLALSTAMLYTFVQPGHSLWSLGHSNVFDSGALAPPAGGGGHGNQQFVGGQIYFGGGVPLYRNGRIIGALGVSGDTSCADHEIAKRVRNILGLNPPGGATVDDISYSSADGASPFTHPLCLNTYRNGVFLGTEANAVGY